MAAEILLPWQDDRVHTKSSMEILVEWISSGENYARWKRGDLTSLAVFDCINRLFLSDGLQQHPNESIQHGVSALEAQMANAKALLAQSSTPETTTIADSYETVRIFAVELPVLRHVG